ncbi:TIGR03619 family F420-dependent LLM class oxidoreductase [bacterium]|nr:TIGR03619 family F420-dependent LLM class oxidoreductase [Acidimicrobiaceae bacterium]MCH9804191.1 TIGR03619 family F420-dependent LLM class oxidoreductase [bacterium]
MKLTVDYPSVAFREGPAKVLELGKALEDIGYDEIAVFDHVVMGFPTDTRPPPMYPPKMPVLEALILLAQLAAVTDRIGLSTEVLVLPQRQPVLVAKQISTIDLMSEGRVRLGVGVGWQESEYDALEEDFTNRGRRMDEAIALLRTYWSDEQIDFDGEYYSSTAMAMEPKPAQDGGPEIWIGGGSKAALRRTGQLGDGWMGSALAKEETIVASVTAIRAAAEAAGRDPASIGLQMMLQPPPSKEEDKAYYADHDQVVQRVVRLKELGFEWVSLNATAVFQAGARSVDAMIEQLGLLHAAITAETA